MAWPLPVSETQSTGTESGNVVPSPSRIFSEPWFSHLRSGAMKSTLLPSQESKIQINSFGGKCHINSRAQIFRLGCILGPPTEFLQIPMPGPQYLTFQFHWSGGQPGPGDSAELPHAAKVENHCPRVLWGTVPHWSLISKANLYFLMRMKIFIIKGFCEDKSRKYIRVHKVVYPRFLINA